MYELEFKIKGFTDRYAYKTEETDLDKVVKTVEREYGKALELDLTGKIETVAFFEIVSLKTW